VTPLAVGVDVGGTKIQAVALGDAGEILDRERGDTPHVVDAVPGSTLAGAIESVVTTMLARLRTSPDDVVVGVGVPGMVAYDGTLVFAPNLPSANGARIATALATLPAHWRALCENDADCAVVAEHRLGAARGIDDVVMVTLGTGIGGGIISSGTLVRGRSGFAGEIGHMVVDANGPRCVCGGRGCWERYASGAGVARLAREAAHAGKLPTLVARCGGDPDAVRGEDVTGAAADGLDEALAVIDDVGWWLALGIANVVAIMDAAHVVLGGGLASASSVLLPAARRHLGALVEGGGTRPVVTIVASQFGPDAGAVGAALLASERLA
jgi:glucokinase